MAQVAYRCARRTAGASLLADVEQGRPAAEHAAGRLVGGVGRGTLGVLSFLIPFGLQFFDDSS